MSEMRNQLINHSLHGVQVVVVQARTPAHQPVTARKSLILVYECKPRKQQDLGCLGIKHQHFLLTGDQ
jgi:hypothetical protein